MICDVCQQIFVTDDAGALFYACLGIQDVNMPHHGTYQSLKSSVDAGCFICTGLWMVLQRVQQTNTIFKQSLSTGSAGTRPISTLIATRQFAPHCSYGDGDPQCVIRAQLSNISDSFECLLTSTSAPK